MNRTTKLLLLLTLFCCGVCVNSCRKKEYRTTEFNGEMISLKGLETVPALPRDERGMQTIDLSNVFDNPGILDFAHNVKDYHFIFLETNKECLLGEVKKVIITDTLVFVLDTYKSNALFVFRYNGSFLRRIGRVGKGPGEYIQATDFYVDAKKGVITLYDQFKASLMDYSLKDGSYINQKKMLFRFHSFTIVGNRYIMEANAAPNNHIPSINPMAMLVCSEDLKIKSASLAKNPMKLAPSLLFKVDDNTAAINLALTDTIYHTDGKHIRPKYCLKFNKKTRLPNDYREQAKFDYIQMYRMFPFSKYSYFTGEYAENTTHLFIWVYYNHNIFYLFYNKQTRQLLSGTPERVPKPEPISPMSFFDDIAPMSNYKDMFIALKKPTTVSWAVKKYFHIEDDTVETELSRAEAVLLERYPQLKKVEYEDNPILVLYSLK